MMNHNDLFLLIGISGSGKTTYGKRLEEFGAVRLCADEIRGVIGKNDSDQTVSVEAFKYLKVFCELLIKNGKSVIIDCVNKDKRTRKDFIDIAKKYKVKTSAYCFPSEVSKSMERMKNREKKVPEEIVRRQFSQMEWPKSEEGEFDRIVWIEE